MEFDFPISDYYKGHILDGETLIRNGPWWTAILLMRDPKSKEPFIGVYRWQKTAEGWKVRKRFSFKTQEEIKKVVETLTKFSGRLKSKKGH